MRLDKVMIISMRYMWMWVISIIIIKITTPLIRAIIIIIKPVGITRILDIFDIFDDIPLFDRSF